MDLRSVSVACAIEVLTEERMPTDRCKAAFRFLLANNSYYKAYHDLHKGLVQQKASMNISSYGLFVVHRGIECAMFPHLYPVTDFTDTGILEHTATSDRSNRSRDRSIESIDSIDSIIFVRSKFLEIVAGVNAIQPGQNSSKSEPPSRFSGRLKILAIFISIDSKFRSIPSISRPRAVVDRPGTLPRAHW